MGLVHGGVRGGDRARAGGDRARNGVRLLRAWARHAFGGLLVGAALAGVTHAFEPGVLPLVGAAFGGTIGVIHGASEEGADPPN